jgi:hypothetical protein
MKKILLLVVCAIFTLNINAQKIELPADLTISELEKMLKEQEKLPFTAYDYLENIRKTQTPPYDYKGDDRDKRLSFDYKWKIWTERKLISYELVKKEEVGITTFYYYQSKLTAEGEKYAVDKADYPTEIYPGSSSNPQSVMTYTEAAGFMPDEFKGRLAQNALLRMGVVDFKEIISIDKQDYGGGYVFYSIKWRTYWKEKTPFLIEGTSAYDSGEQAGKVRVTGMMKDKEGKWTLHKTSWGKE